MMTHDKGKAITVSTQQRLTMMTQFTTTHNVHRHKDVNTQTSQHKTKKVSEKLQILWNLSNFSTNNLYKIKKFAKL